MGRAARTCRDMRLLARLLDLLGDPGQANRAADLVFEMEESPAFDLLLAGASDQRVPILIDLAKAATPDQAATLRAVGEASELRQDARVILKAVVDEWSRSGHSRQAEPRAGDATGEVK